MPSSEPEALMRRQLFSMLLLIILLVCCDWACRDQLVEGAGSAKNFVQAIHLTDEA
jgi:hypothetical protein